MNFFGKKPTVKEQMRENDKALRKAGRNMDRDIHQLERDEKNLERDIKKAASENNRQACIVLAKQLVLIRKQKTHALAAKGKVQAIGMQSKSMSANVKLAEAMGESSKTMANMNKIMNPEKMAHDVREFEKAAMKMGMTEEIVNDTLDDILGESGDEEESDAIVNQVLDEIGIEISGKLSKASAAPQGIPEQSLPSEDDLVAQLAKLRS